MTSYSPVTVCPVNASMSRLAEHLAMIHQACLPFEAWSPKSFQDMLNLSTTHILGAFTPHEDASCLVGFLCCQRSDTLCDILSLCVLNPYRKQGLGSALIRMMISLFEQEGEHVYTLEVAQNNIEAVRLYTHCGFTIQGVRPNYYHTDGGWVSAYMMTRSIACGAGA